MKIEDKYIDVADIKDYFNRLLTPYFKKGVEKIPFFQFAEGGGQELGSKFWNKKSSSRLAFDLYSWMEFDDAIKDFEFEFHLPGLASGGSGANMDVFFETEKSVFFIESKFSENVDNLKAINNLSEAYYAENFTNRKHINVSLTDRYYGLGEVGKQISKFIKELKETVRHIRNPKDTSEWFDVKQEICHVVGILLFLLKDNGKNAKMFQNKDNIFLYNIFWKFRDDKIEDNEYLNAFIASFKGLKDGLTTDYPILKKFKFGVLSIDDVRKGALFNIDSTINISKDINKILAYYDKLAEHCFVRSNFYNR